VTLQKQISFFTTAYLKLESCQKPLCQVLLFALQNTLHLKPLATP